MNQTEISDLVNQEVDLAKYEDRVVFLTSNEWAARGVIVNENNNYSFISRSHKYLIDKHTLNLQKLSNGLGNVLGYEPENEVVLSIHRTHKDFKRYEELLENKLYY